MARIAIAAYLIVLATAANSQTHNSTGIVTHAEYQQFVGSHKISKKPNVSLIETNSEKGIERKDSMLLLKMAKTGKQASVKIKKEKERGR